MSASGEKIKFKAFVKKVRLQALKEGIEEATVDGEMAIVTAESLVDLHVYLINIVADRDITEIAKILFSVRPRANIADAEFDYHLFCLIVSIRLLGEETRYERALHHLLLFIVLWSQCVICLL